jgi:hypothetical protein
MRTAKNLSIKRGGRASLGVGYYMVCLIIRPPDSCILFAFPFFKASLAKTFVSAIYHNSLSLIKGTLLILG